jgi:hypothetical protein
LYERRMGRTQTLADLDGDDEHYRTSAYRALLRQAYADLHGPAPSSWAAGVDAQYADGLEPAYSRMLDRLGIRTTLWDYRRLARDAWPGDRYRLIYWIDPFICPFADARLSRGAELQQALAEILELDGRLELPPDFEEYLAFVGATLARARPGLVGLKLLLGYHRSLHVEDVSFETAQAAYLQLLEGDLVEYGQFQDFMVGYLFRSAGELDLPLQIHASFGGPGSKLNLTHNQPALLEPLLSRADASQTRVVLLHGGYPFVSQAAALTWMHPRVYLDFSVLPSLFALPLARWLEEWLELLPRDRLLFGTDASSPELYYTAAVNGRRQLGRALDNLVAGGGLSRNEAVETAERVCFTNAVELYGLADLAPG